MPGKELERRIYVDSPNALSGNFVDTRSQRGNLLHGETRTEEERTQSLPTTYKGRHRCYMITKLWFATLFASTTFFYACDKLDSDYWQYVDPEARAITLYSQQDEQWKQNISPIWNPNATCGPTLTAMLLSTYGEKLTPPEVDAIFAQKGFRKTPDSGTLFRGDPNQKDVLNWLTKEKGFEAVTISDTAFAQGGIKRNFDFNSAKQLLDQGYYIVASGDVDWVRDQKSWSNHIFGIIDVDPEMRSFRVFDPWDGTIQKRHISQVRGQFFHYSIALKKPNS